MKFYEIDKEQFFISTDKNKLDVTFIHNYLSKETYWAKNIPIQIVQKSIDGSFCFGLFVAENVLEVTQINATGRQVGFARVVTDYATFAYLADVFIIDNYRGKGLSKRLMETIINHPELQGLRRWMLATKDAHGLYAQFGFLPLDKPERIMGFKPFEEYPATQK
jgi:GNAT superfamily N-acetyltransferase